MASAVMLAVVLLLMTSSLVRSHQFLGELVSSKARGRQLRECASLNPLLRLDVDATEPLADVQNVTVTVSGVLVPDPDDWIALVSPSHANNYTDNCPYAKLLYLETGDTQQLPLLCHYPIKFQYVKADAQYLSCERAECEFGASCLVRTCSASLTFRLINIRSEVVMVFMGHGLVQPCLLLASAPLSFANPVAPLYGHLSSLTSSATSMRLTWVSGDKQPQHVVFGKANTSATSSVTTFQQGDMCGTEVAPATEFGWHDPGFIHSAILTGLLPSSWHEYQYGSDKVGWSKRSSFRTPPAAGARAVNLIMYADMGKKERDGSDEHFLQEGALDVIDAVTKAVDAGDIDVVFHVGDISYATGFLVEWDMFLEMISPVASRVPYMTASGNHERDFPGSGSVYETPDSGGECGVPYETYFQMPSQGADKPWYSIEYGPIHLTVMSTEMAWVPGSEQYAWLDEDLASVNRSQTPWVIFSGVGIRSARSIDWLDPRNCTADTIVPVCTAQRFPSNFQHLPKAKAPLRPHISPDARHRPLYSSAYDDFITTKLLPSVDSRMTEAIEPLLVQHKVDLAIWGHVHQYERTCATYKNKCISKPFKYSHGIDTYNSSSYGGPIHLIIGNAGFHLDHFVEDPLDWSLVRISEFGYTHIYATHERLQIELILANSGAIGDQFELLKSPSPTI